MLTLRVITFFDVGTSDKYRLTDFSFVNCNITDSANSFNKSVIENTKIKNLVINGKKAEMTSSLISFC